MSRVRHQEHGIGKRQHRQPAAPAEQIAIGEEPGPLVIIGAQFGPERRGGYLERRQRDPHQQRAAEHVEQGRRLRPGRRVPQQQPADRDRQGGGIHPRMPPSPAAARVIGEIAHRRVDERLDHQRTHDRDADGAGRQADHLVVEQQQEGREAIVLHAVRDRSDPERQPAAQAERARRRRGDGSSGEA